MDLSALIFVALAVAWAVYLIPKALKHHDDVVRSRSVDRFSHTMRVLARREPWSHGRNAPPGRQPRSRRVAAGRDHQGPVRRSVADAMHPSEATARAAASPASGPRPVLVVSLLATVGVAAFGLITLVVGRAPRRRCWSPGWSPAG